MQIKLLVMDVDGTLTDGKIYMGANGELMKAFDIKDGCGIKDILPTLGIIPVVITARKSDILNNRCDELCIKENYQGVRNKLSKLEEICSNYGVSLNNVAYVGDDILDLQCMKPIKQAGGFVACPADAVSSVRDVADFVSSRDGGSGAVREVIEYLKRQQEEYLEY